LGRPRLNIRNQTFGSLTALYSRWDDRGDLMWMVACSCGSRFFMPAGDLIRGKHRGHCGCQDRPLEPEGDWDALKTIQKDREASVKLLELLKRETAPKNGAGVLNHHSASANRANNKSIPGRNANEHTK